MKKIIVTADDFGMCSLVDDAILDMFSKKALSSTNVLTNMDTWESAVKLKSYENISVGIHWNITTGVPVLNPATIPSIVKEDGSFYSLTELRSRVSRHLINMHEVENELKAQYDRLLSVYGKAVYWNTHENSGLIPAIYKVCASVAKESKIPCTRNFQRVYLDYDLVKSKKRRLREFLVRNLMDYWFGIKAKKDFVMPAGRIITFYNAEKCNLPRMEAALKGTKKRSVEVVIHPATVGQHRYFGNIGNDRVNEYRSYISDDFLQLWQKYEFCSFDDLMRCQKSDN